MEVEHEVDQGALEPGALAKQRHKAALGDAHGALGFEEFEPLGDLPVLFKPIFLGAGSSPALDLDVVVFASAIRGLRRRQVGQGEQLLAQLGFQRLSLLFKHRHLLLDAVAFVAQFLHLRAVGGRTGFDL